MNKTTDDSDDAAEPAVPEDALPGDKEIERIDAAFDARDDAMGEPPPPAGARDAAARPARRGLSAFVAWLALLLALLALAVSSYVAWQSQASNNDAADDLAATGTRLSELSRELDEAVESLRAGREAAEREVADAGRRSASMLEGLQRDFRELGERNDSLAPRLDYLENAIASLQGVSAGVRDTWILAEAEYYMQIANAQLQLAGNPRIAALALEFADERIRQMADPALGGVRQALTEELQALDAMETFDLEGTTLALSSLAGRVGALPLNQTAAGTERADAPVDPELSGFSRAVASMKQAFGDIVSVRRTDEALTPMLSPEAAYFLRANLALQFQAARLALLKGQQGVFEQSLNDASKWLREYYDTDSQAVASVLETLDELADSTVDAMPPDISRSLKLLRQYRTLRDTDSSGGSGNAGDGEEPDR